MFPDVPVVGFMDCHDHTRTHNARKKPLNVAIVLTALRFIAEMIGGVPLMIPLPSKRWRLCAPGRCLTRAVTWCHDHG
jgi:hypothetical protein